MVMWRRMLVTGLAGVAIAVAGVGGSVHASARPNAAGERGLSVTKIGIRDGASSQVAPARVKRLDIVLNNRARAFALNNFLYRNRSKKVFLTVSGKGTVEKGYFGGLDAIYPVCWDACQSANPVPWSVTLHMLDGGRDPRLVTHERYGVVTVSGFFRPLFTDMGPFWMKLDVEAVKS